MIAIWCIPANLKEKQPFVVTTMESDLSVQYLYWHKSSDEKGNVVSLIFVIFTPARFMFKCDNLIFRMADTSLSRWTTEIVLLRTKKRNRHFEIRVRSMEVR